MSPLLLVLLSACATPAPTTPEGCAALADAAARDECVLALLPAVFRSDPARGVELTTNAISDPVTRDFAWLTVTRDVDPHSGKYCARIADPLLKERCNVLVARPHLHREPGAPGQPGAPGAPGQPGAPGTP